MKFFNLVARDVGSQLLYEGIWIEGMKLKEFLRTHMEVILNDIYEVQIDGTMLISYHLHEKMPLSERVFLKIS